MLKSRKCLAACLSKQKRKEIHMLVSISYDPHAARWTVKTDWECLRRARHFKNSNESFSRCRQRNLNAADTIPWATTKAAEKIRHFEATVPEVRILAEQLDRELSYLEYLVANF